jgi:hypothetical protein
MANKRIAKYVHANLERAINIGESEFYYIISVLSVAPVSVYSTESDLIKIVKDSHSESAIIPQITNF